MFRTAGRPCTYVQRLVSQQPSQSTRHRRGTERCCCQKRQQYLVTAWLPRQRFARARHIRCMHVTDAVCTRRWRWALSGSFIHVVKMIITSKVLLHLKSIFCDTRDRCTVRDECWWQRQVRLSAVSIGTVGGFGSAVTDRAPRHRLQLGHISHETVLVFLH